VTVRIVGGGWYGCHLALALKRRGIDVELHEAAGELFSGASGANPARLHRGFHYPRSRLTRAACLDHADAFMAAYGPLTRAIPLNLYCVAAEESLVDFGTYRDTMRSSGAEFLTAEDPAAYGLQGVEGALLTGERHVVIDEARAFFAGELEGVASFHRRADDLDDPAYELTVDCTFCALDAEAVDRYEPCMTVLMEGPTDRAVTIMDGPFPSIYPWKEAEGLVSLTSARFTPLSKTCRTFADAQRVASDACYDPATLGGRAVEMLDQIGAYWPAALDLFRIADIRVAVRAMPKSGADARLVDVVRVGQRSMRVRAGKIDAVFRAEALILEAMGCKL
jgi:hypothetical protein